MSYDFPSLTDEEKRIFQGEEGIVKQKCMQYLVEMCQISGADRLVDLDGTGDMHTPGLALSQFYQITLDELRDFADNGGRFAIPTFANKSPFGEQPPIHGWESCNICGQKNPEWRQDDPAFHEKAMHEDEFAVLRKMGMMTTHSCANYLTMSYLPSVGQHCSWFESSQMPYCNATLGARTNFDGTLATCLLGKAPYYDMHITENRWGTILVEVDRKIKTDLEWDVYGFTVGEAVDVEVPIVTGTARPTTTQYQKFNSAMSTGGAVRMYHLPGITPEAPTIEFAAGGRKLTKTIKIDDSALRRNYDILNFHTSNDVDMVYLGCPHLNIVDLMKLAGKLDGKKVKIPLWIMTAPWLYPQAKALGYIDIFEKAGAHLMSGACLAAMGAVPDGVRSIAVDTAKQAYYITGCYPDENDPLQVCYGSSDDCIDAAITGKWRGEWR
ncbi:MAG: aconitase X catalytic domain-containing protein [Oscillospiraceae bacterium]|jgi:predicted aconitase|nr:aconitase X catalytic domain-containing protein [Oscillospiraceae bacterium]